MKFSTVFNILLLICAATANIQGTQGSDSSNLEKHSEKNRHYSFHDSKYLPINKFNDRYEHHGHQGHHRHHRHHGHHGKPTKITKTKTRTIPLPAPTSESNPIKFNGSIGDLTFIENPLWEVTENGLYSNAVDKGDSFIFTKTNSTNFVYSTTLTFKDKKGNASLLFRSNGNLINNKEGYVANIDVTNSKCKLTKWQRGDVLDLTDEKDIKLNDNGTYNLKVVAYDSWILFYVNDELFASTGDYVIQHDNKGQDTFIENGVFGLMNSNSDVTFSNTYFKSLEGEFNPLLKDIDITSNGTVEKKSPFVSTEPVRIQYVHYDASVVQVKTTKESKNGEVEIIDKKGKSYKEGEDIPVDLGVNYLVVKNTVTSEDGKSATATYHINVHRFKKDNIYYNENYRDQYHYSVKEGWDNDPNGLVYFNGKYHLFYQFYDDIVWGPMHWAHATSKDLLHWENQPIALYPDANGAMYSGSIVADVNNTSGLFKTNKGGLVAFIAVDGNGERIKVAYSEDEGITWNKLDKIAIDWTNDPMKSIHFRDPKVFRWEGKWFMVIAGGPFRLYSSDDLQNWKVEYTNPDDYTECPDLYPIKADDGKIKWIFVGSKEFPGRKRFYKVGEFKKVGENWKYIIDKEFESFEGTTSFGKDAYASMTYYVQDFGTEANPTLPEIVELNWMSSWEYSKILAKNLKQDYAGTFSLNLKLGFIKKDGMYQLTETPIKKYEELRIKNKAKKYKNKTLTEKNTLLKNFKGELYEIIAKFRPSEGTKKIGFRLRTGGKEKTLVYYDNENQKIVIDRSKSGVILNEMFRDVDSRDMKLNEDGTVDMHIFVDRSSVELFTKNYTINAANQIFPSRKSLGISVLVEGEKAKGDITIYPLKSIWKN